MTTWTPRYLKLERHTRREWLDRNGRDDVPSAAEVLMFAVAMVVILGGLSLALLAAERVTS